MKVTIGRSGGSGLRPHLTPAKRGDAILRALTFWSTRLSFRSLRLPLFALTALAALVVFASQGPKAPTSHKPTGRYDQFIVQFKPGSELRGVASTRQQFLDQAGKSDGLSVGQLRRLAVGADVIRTSRKLDEKEAQDFMNRMRKDPRVRFVEVDRLLKPDFVPNDPSYTNQWHYYEPTGGINLPAAWDQSTGAGVVVAVIDTGITTHPDLDANIVAGYDFISDDKTARDGDGYDPDPADQGDWVTADYCDLGSPAQDSTWHGTHVAGTVAAVSNNAKGVAGVAFNAKVMPLRVLGRCGGSTSDIANAIVWAAGGAVQGVPNNPNPVEVINMSLGGEGDCSITTQQAIDFAVSRGVVVVVAAGNDNSTASTHEPANCNNVITVGATNRSGGRAGYSNYG
ncbi:MAG: S8 family serine peptidase, partial [Steroidobacteraceae bacterium]